MSAPKNHDENIEPGRFHFRAKVRRFSI